jgi:hypothetical protein
MHEVRPALSFMQEVAILAVIRECGTASAVSLCRSKLAHRRDLQTRILGSLGRFRAMSRGGERGGGNKMRIRARVTGYHLRCSLPMHGHAEIWMSGKVGARRICAAVGYRIETKE